MNGFGFGGSGNGKWGVDDSARSFVEYHLVNGTDMDSGSGGRANRAAGSSERGNDKLLISIVFWGCLITGFVVLAALGLNMLAAVILAIPFTAAATLIFGVTMALVQAGQERRRKCGGAVGTDGEAPDEAGKPY